MAENERRGPATELAIANMTTLKPEHQALLSTLLADAGMATTTLETLVEHLFEEEDPRLVHALARARAGVPVATLVAASRRPTATVGDLRRHAPPTEGRPTEGRPTEGRARGSVGSLRR